MRITNVVAAAGIVVEVEQGGYYRVSSWVRFEGSQAASKEVFESLTWAEASDVVSAELASHRPGWAIGDGCRQPPLFP